MFEDMGTNTLTVSVTGRGSSRTVDADDMYDLYEENSDVFSAMSHRFRLGQDQERHGLRLVLLDLGHGRFRAVRHHRQAEHAEGRFLSYSDLESRSKVAVVGSYLNKSVSAAGRSARRSK